MIRAVPGVNEDGFALGHHHPDYGLHNIRIRVIGKYPHMVRNSLEFHRFEFLVP
jgi:hypothetical protein